MTSVIPAAKHDILTHTQNQKKNKIKKKYDTIQNKYVISFYLSFLLKHFLATSRRIYSVHVSIMHLHV